MWLEAHKKNALPPEWRLAHNFLTWATANEYKTEYGYKDEFTPGNLLMAMKGDDKDALEVESLVKNHTAAELKKITEVMGVDIGKSTKKEDIAKLIVAADIQIGVDYGQPDSDMTDNMTVEFPDEPQVIEYAG
jgi:hypothetical protein